MPKKTHKALTKAELALISQLLQEASDEFSNHGCNDFTLPATEENKAIVAEMYRSCLGKEDADEEMEELENEKDELFINDWMLMDYLANRCKQLSKS
jgi:hypothetical protein